MSDPAPGHLDLLATAAWDEAPPRAVADATGRCWVGIHFECCGVYSRIYRDPATPRYEGCCPRCGCRIHLQVGSDGVDSRIFRAVPV